MLQINTKEIERKFLIDKEGFLRYIQNSANFKMIRITQGYLCKSTRVRIDDMSTITIKSINNELERSEYIYEIPIKDAEEILANMCEKRIINKTRYSIEYFGFIWEVDVFDGSDLILAELELEDVSDSYEKPPWVGKEVTGEPQYYNCNMVDWS